MRNSYRVLIPSGNGARREEIKADTFDVDRGVLIFYDNYGKKIAAFKEWLRIDRMI